MLFDERKNPFHLMLRDLLRNNGLDAFFKTYESLAADGAFDQNSSDESIDCPHPRSEFLDSWLSLLEKLVNPKLILETPHTMAPKSNTAIGYEPFDATQYLIKVHKHAFNAITSLWSMYPKKFFSDQTSDHILTILCHLLKGETIILENLNKGKEIESVPNPIVGNPATVPTQPADINQEHLQQLMDMGFGREAVINALIISETVEQATDLLLSTAPASSNWTNQRSQEGQQDVDMATEEPTEIKPIVKNPSKEEPLSKKEIDEFTENLLTGALLLMDELPSTVFKVCDLIVTVAQRNGEKKWCSQLLKQLLSEIVDNVKKLLELAEPLRANDSRSFQEWVSQSKNEIEANKVAVRVHLYSLLFDERKVQCANLIHETNALDCLLKLLEKGYELFETSVRESPSPMPSQTPKWLAPTILLIDLYEKGAVASHRRAPLLDNQVRTWQYFDERTGRWTPHVPANNKIIDDAYKNGEPYARYSVGRKRYFAQFSSMLQVNEDTNNLRPIMMTLNSNSSKNQHDENNFTPTVPKLHAHQKEELLKVCVGFLELPIDPNSLEAVMRLSFRLTRDYEFAKFFANQGGVKALQKLPETSQFNGFESLATLIIRHVLEEPSVLTQTMEKVIRSTTQHSQQNQREMHSLLRALGPAASRNEEIFKKLAIEILRITPSPLSSNDDDSARSKPDIPQIIKLLPPKTSSETIKTKAVDQIRNVITDLLDSLTIPVQAKPSDLTKPVRFTTSPASPTPDPKSSAESSAKTNDAHSIQPNRLLNHSMLLRLLAELTRSYSVVPKIIAEHTFGSTPALAFILDNILPTTQSHSDRDGPPLARVFLAALASCNHCVDAQVAIVTEVKASLNRAASMPESCEKHARLQSLATLIGTMIECCPAITPQQTGSRNSSATAQQQLSNNIVRLFVRRGLVTDLARIPHSLDLSAPHMFATINAILKPLETLSRFVNLPDQLGQTRDQAPPSKKACSSSSSSSDMPEDEANGEVSGVDEREEDADDEDDDDDDDEDDDEDQDHVEDDDDHVDDDEVDDDENLNAFGDNQYADDYRIYNGQLNNVLSDIEEVFLQQSNNVLYTQRLNEILPSNYDEQQHELAAPTLPPPPGNVGLNHPLLLRRLDQIPQHGPLHNPGAPPVLGRAHRYGRPRLLRGPPGSNNSQWHGIATSRHPPQTILQQLLGPGNIQDVMTLTNQIVGPGRFFVTDFQNWLATEDELYPDSTDPNTLNSPSATALASIPLVMARWTEESRILDGGSLHDCLTLVKQTIVEALERFKEEENLDRQEKRRKVVEDEDQSQQKKTKEPEMNVAEETEQPPVLEQIEQPEPMQQQPSEPPEQQVEVEQPSEPVVTEEPKEEASPEQPIQQPEQPAEQAQSSSAPPAQEDQPRQEQSQPMQEDNMNEIPDGVDPSFLAALPEDIRQEVLAEQWRLRRLERANNNRQTNPAPNTSTDQGASTSSGTTFPEINPEFLAALPVEVQEEVLAQQRAEQQRQAAINTNPDQPVDPAIFIQTLAPNLRRQVLADMDDSLLSLLPSDLAAEAQSLRRELLTSNVSANSTLSRLLRTAAAGRMQRARYTITSVPNHVHNQPSWTWALDRQNGSLSHSNNSSRNLLALSKDAKFKGRQLLDCEALTCLVILLFVEEPRLNIARLHRVIRNLSYHQPTRQWVVHSMLSIIDRARSSDGTSRNAATPGRGKKNAKSDDPGKLNHSSSWLSISMDAALGCRASVFAVQNSPYTGKDILLHSQAAPSVCRHMLEALIALAKSFPQHFFPNSLQSSDDSTDADTASSTNACLEFWEILAKLDSVMSNTNKKSKSSSKPANTSNSAGPTRDEIDSSLAKLIGFLAHPIIRRSFTLTDRLLHLLAVISMAFPTAFDSVYEPWQNPPLRTGYARRSPHGRTFYSQHGPLHRPFSYHQQQLPQPPPPVPVSNSVQLSALPEESQMVTDSSSPMQIKKPDIKPKQPLVTKPYLKLAVDVLTSKSCSEEGLDDVTSLLSRLSRTCSSTRAGVLELLMEGAQQLGRTVCQHISTLKVELEDYNQKLRIKAINAATEGTSPGAKGVVLDRFTNDSVIITAPSGSKSGREVQLPSMANLTSKNSSQAFFLRILKVIIQLRETSKPAAAPTKPRDTPVQDSSANNQSAMEVDPNSASVNDVTIKIEETVKLEESLSIELNSRLDNLWETLSQCLKELAETPDHHAVLVLQPAVEAFFLVHSPGSSQRGVSRQEDHSVDRNSQTAHIDQEVAPISPSDNQQQTDATGTATTQSYDTEKFLEFAEKHRVVLNHILRQSTTPLSQGPFAVLVDHTRILDFDVKRRYFRQELERLDEGIRRDDLGIHVRRDNVFEESFRELHRRLAEDWKNRFFVVFEDEEGQDAGGLLREWYTIISREIFNPMYALFTTSPGDRVTYMINSASHCNTNHLTYFKFVGRVIAKAIYDNKLLDCYFTRSFYKHILGKPVKYTDMESEDYSFYKSLVFLLEHDVKELGYELTFSVEVREFGVTEVRELKANGSNIPVTEENKQEYVRLVCQEKMTGSIRKQLNAFLEGFYDIIPKRLISIFNEQELELLISGLPYIDIDDLKASTEYHKYLPNSLQIQWFWRALRSFDQADRAKLLQFVTGTSKVPLQGFASLEGMNGVQKFQIHRDERSTDRLPSAHTCFNQLDLPVYETYDKLRYMLLKAIQECSEGFGLA